MKPNIKNILIFTIIGVALVVGYLYFFGGGGTEEANIVPYNEPANLNPDGSADNTGEQATGEDAFNQDLLSLLLSVKNIRLEDAIFRDTAFIGLRDSSIILAPVVDEGRPNPFAPIGFDAVEPIFTEENLEETPDESENGEELDLGLDELESLLDF